MNNPAPNLVEHQRYSAVAIVLHWAIAIAILLMIPLGWWMGDAIDNPETQGQAFAAFQLHKSVGLSILALSLVRLVWRLTHKPAALPAHMPAWEKFVAIATHWAFYALMIGIPLTGWLYVSTGWSAPNDRPLEVPTVLFGAIPVPHLFGLSHLAEATRSTLAAILEFIHSKLAWVVIVLAALHVGAALKHHVIDKDNVLTHMIPGLKPMNQQPELQIPPPSPPPSLGRSLTLGGGLALIAIALFAGVFAFINGGKSAPEAYAAETGASTSASRSVGPNAWAVDASASAIRFHGTHVGNPFTGTFRSWSADITFDPDNLDAAHVLVTIDTASAHDGVALHDQSLPSAEWFNVAAYPTATFESDSFATTPDGYVAHGTLTIKDNEIPVDLPFTLNIEGSEAIMDARIEIDRAAADLGQSSDPSGEYVSPEIEVEIHVEAARGQ